MRGSAPTSTEEEALANQGYTIVAGVDEVGRGPLAGPVVAGAIVLPWSSGAPWFAEVRDSKALSPAQREYLYPYLVKEAYCGIGAASNHEIDELGISVATRLAMVRALADLPCTPEFILVDGRPVDLGPTPTRAIVRGDASCLSIAAASVLAKVSRDAHMKQEDERYPHYGFSRHKGYGTSAHLDALRRFGPCPIHRRSFAPVTSLAATSGARHD